jgi:hypothetical protein
MASHTTEGVVRNMKKADAVPVAILAVLLPVGVASPFGAPQGGAALLPTGPDAEYQDRHRDREGSSSRPPERRVNPAR